MQTALMLMLGTAAVQAGWGDRSPPGADLGENAPRPAGKAAKDKDKDKDADKDDGGGAFSVFTDPPRSKTPKKAVAEADKNAKDGVRERKDADEKKEAAPAKKSDARPPSVADEAAAEREREMQALVRRQMVCLKLMRIAMDAGDDELLKKAEAMDERAREIYARRTAHLPGARQANFDSDEGTLERHLGSPNRPKRGHSELLLKDKNGTSQAQAREDRP